MSNDDEVRRYYELEIRLKLNNYIDPLPTVDIFNGCPRTELTSRMESYRVWYPDAGKGQFMQRVKQELPELELTFQRKKDHYYSAEEVKKREDAFHKAEAVEFRSICTDAELAKLGPDFGLKSGGIAGDGLQDIIMFKAYGEFFPRYRDRLTVPEHWDDKKRWRFIAYVKRIYPSGVKRETERRDRMKQQAKMEKFRKRLAKEKEEAEYQAFKLRTIL